MSPKKDKDKDARPALPDPTPPEAVAAPTPEASVATGEPYTTIDLYTADFLRRHGVDCPEATSGTPMVYRYHAADSARIAELLQLRAAGTLR